MTAKTTILGCILAMSVFTPSPAGESLPLAAFAADTTASNVGQFPDTLAGTVATTVTFQYKSTGGSVQEDESAKTVYSLNVHLKLSTLSGDHKTAQYLEIGSLPAHSDISYTYSLSIVSQFSSCKERASLNYPQSPAVAFLNYMPGQFASTLAASDNLGPSVQYTGSCPNQLSSVISQVVPPGFCPQVQSGSGSMLGTAESDGTVEFGCRASYPDTSGGTITVTRTGTLSPCAAAQGLRRPATSTEASAARGISPTFLVGASQPIAGQLAENIAACTPLIANPGGPYTVVRADSVTLDGQKSTIPAGQVATWTWALSTGKNCPDASLARTTFTGDTVGPFVVLCDLDVKLTLRAGGKTSSKSTTITVQPRGAPFETTDVTSDTVFATSDEPGVPESAWHGNYGLRGRNTSACAGAHATDEQLNEALCPQSREGSYYAGGAYDIASVQGGPFSGWAYVSATSFKVSRRGIVNVALGPYARKPQGANSFAFDKNIYFYNERVNSSQWHGFLEAESAHENWGAPGIDRSGHSQTMRSAIQEDDSANVRKAIEGLVDSNSTGLKAQVEAASRAADAAIRKASADPLAVIGQYRVFLWDDERKVYYPAICTVPAIDVLPCIDDVKATTVSPPGPITPGRDTQVKGGGFAPRERVQIELHSATAVIGAAVAGADGSVTAEVRIPSNTPAGLHEVILRGLASGITQSLNVRVNPVQSSSQRQLGDDSGLANTGVGPGMSSSGLLGLLLVVAGATIMIRTGRRGRRRSH